MAFYVLVGFIVLSAFSVFASNHSPDLQRKLRLLRELNPKWDEDILVCREIMRHGSKSFFLASLLLPKWMRDTSLALYSFCRQADDEVDQEADSLSAASRLARLELRLADAYAGHPEDTCVDRCFSATVRAFEVPRGLPAALLDGFRWDLGRPRCRSLPE
eukprot:CAMPEP_0113661888 /NCGR_PEP_ID=MMETSP0038_2-20120614/249_1 /TAXON_ID=2898 /ORGANISM="Cryptomonas paramecium" /LENGTH=159 /DNA_ID=CAMNT_0000576679 /DNA_START=255 /DNA_END=731 /DNA_ORIENTATION=- /assembly_acc=CAM_ASM_000170